MKRSCIRSAPMKQASHATAAVYTRLSKDREGQTSTARQESEAKEWAARNGLEVVETYSDAGLSGFRPDVVRPGFEEALAALEAGKFGTLVVWKLDRLTRRGMGKVGEVLDRLEATGGRIVSVMDGVDSSTSSGRLIIAVLSELARAESENMSTRTRSALRARKAAGRWMGGRPPYGFRVTAKALKAGNNPASFHIDPEAEPGRLVVDPATGPVLRGILDRLLAGDTTYEVAQWLNADGVPGPRGGKWAAPQIWSMSRSPVLVGQLPDGRGATVPARGTDGEPVTIGEPIMTLHERSSLMAAYAARSATRGGKRRGIGRRGHYVLTGLIRCSECGARMSGGAGRSYVCNAMKVGQRCPGNVVKAEAAEAVVVRDALAHLSRIASLDPSSAVVQAVAARWLATYDRATLAERAGAEAEAEELAARMAALAEERYLGAEFAGPEGAALYNRLRSRLAADLKSARERLASIPKPEADLGSLHDPELLREAWDAGDTATRRAILALVVEEVSVLKAAPGVNVFDPDRIRVRLVGEFPRIVEGTTPAHVGPRSKTTTSPRSCTSSG